MTIIASILSGLAGMISYGVGDFLLKKPSEKVGDLKTTLYVFLFSTLLTIPIWIYFVMWGFIKLGIIDYLLIIVIAFLDLFAFANFLKAIKVGELSIVAPIASSFAIITVILSIIFLHEVLALLQVVAIFLSIFGIILTSTDIRKIHHIRTVEGISNAAWAFLGWGVLFFVSDILIDRITITHGQLYAIIVPYTYSVFISLLLMVAFVYFLNRQKEIFSWKNEISLGRIFIISFIFKAGVVAVNYGLTVGKTSIIAPISSLSPAITVTLAQIFYKEKLVPNQKVGIAIILVGLILISI